MCNSYQNQESQVTSYASKKLMIDSHGAKIREELRKAGLNINDPAYMGGN